MNESDELKATFVFERGLGNFLTLDEVTDEELSSAITELTAEQDRRREQQ